MLRRSVFYRTIRAAGMTAALGLAAAACQQPVQESAADMTKGAIDPVTRGQYLVSISGCNDCHTPGYFFGMPDFNRRLGGSDVGFFMPGMGYFYGPNLTPDEATGIGAWSEDQIVTALRTGARPDGRMLSPIMPWMGLSNLTDEDAYAIAAYLKSLPAVANQAPPPTGTDQPPPAPYMAIVVPEPPPAP
jgi:mono/diheme cytochrome c family protein